jgi:hypothetical protein
MAMEITDLINDADRFVEHIFPFKIGMDNVKGGSNMGGTDFFFKNLIKKPNKKLKINLLVYKKISPGHI